MKHPLKFIILLFSLHYSAFILKAQDVIDVVDPYQMKVSRSKEADTFYFSQKATAIAPKPRLDTLKSYDVFLEERPTPFGTAYMCNGTEVTKQKFLAYKSFWNSASGCTPCMLYTYDDKDQLKHVGYQYGDCLCGSYAEFYPEGNKKVEGQFRENNSDNWSNLKNRNLCNIRTGTWVYYLPNGLTEKTEVYVDGKLISTSNTTTNQQAISKKTTTNKVESTTENETPAKKGFIQRIKDKNNQANN